MKNNTFISSFSGALLGLFLVLGGSHTAQAQAYGPSCTILPNGFYASPTTIAAGQSTTLYWSTSGCTYVTLSGGSFDPNSFLEANSSVSTGALEGTTTYVLSAFGSGDSTSQSVTISVSGGSYPYSYQCPDGSDDPSDPNCSDSQDSETLGSAITTPATNVSSTTARLNGIITNIPIPFVGYFEFGTTPSLGEQTVFQNLADVTSYNLYDTINVQPDTTYYYRAAAEINDTIVRGDTYSFRTPDASTIPVSYVGGSSSGSGNNASSNGNSSTTANSGDVTLTITNKSDNVNIGDTVEDTVTYKNGTDQTLRNAELSVIFPLGFVVTQTTQGAMLNSTSVTADLGTLAAGQTGSIYMEALVGPTTATNSTLVTNGTLTYSLPNGTSDTAVGYVLNHASAENVLAGFALGSGFFPTTIFGWLVTVIIILVIILIARRIAKQKKAAHGHGHAGGHGDHDGHAAPKH